MKVVFFYIYIKNRLIRTLGILGIAETHRWVLRGVIMLIRHGDRGPLQHVKNISFVNCGSKADILLNAYKVSCLLFVYL